MVLSPLRPPGEETSPSSNVDHQQRHIVISHLAFAAPFLHPARKRRLRIALTQQRGNLGQRSRSQFTPPQQPLGQRIRRQQETIAAPTPPTRLLLLLRDAVRPTLARANQPRSIAKVL